MEQHERGLARIEDIVPADYNPRGITDDARAGLAESLKRWGVVQEIVVNRRTVAKGWPPESEQTIVGGHQRVDVLIEEGVESAPVVWVDLDEADEKALNLALNNPAIAGHFTSRVREMVEQLKLRRPEVVRNTRLEEVIKSIQARQLNLLDGKDADPGPIAPPEAPDSEEGRVYELGPHRLVVGDSTDPVIWNALMEGKQGQLVWTDPPYGVAIVGLSGTGLSRQTAAKIPGTSGRRYAQYGSGAAERGGKTIKNDDIDDAKLKTLLEESLGLAVEHTVDGGVFYVASPAGPLFWVFGSVLRDLKVWRHTLVWVKDSFVLGRSDYHYRYEPIFYGWKPGAAHFFVDDRTQDTVFEVPRPKANPDHPTMKPVELVQRQIENSSRVDDVVVDPFGGSGSTLIACAQAQRRARLIELDPKYADVIRRRWTGWATAAGVDPGPGALE